jgi:hypothetical protein
MMTRPDATEVAQLVSRARQTFSTTHHDVPSLFHTSKRTLQRWQAGESRPLEPQLAHLARVVHPVDRALAAEIAQAGGTTLESLGLELPQPAAPLPLPPMPRHLVVDAVVCAAADSTDAAPSAVRATLLAAFRRARELGLSTEEVEKALEERTAKASGKSK